MTSMITFTPGAVRDTLLAAGFTEHHREDGNEGFGLGDGRESRGEIIICWYSGGRQWTSLESMWAAQAAEYEAYRAALAGAGFQVCVDGSYVIVNGLAATP